MDISYVISTKKYFDVETDRYTVHKTSSRKDSDLSYKVFATLLPNRSLTHVFQECIFRAALSNDDVNGNLKTDWVDLKKYLEYNESAEGRNMWM